MQILRPPSSSKSPPPMTKVRSPTSNLLVPADESPNPESPTAAEATSPKELSISKSDDLSMSGDVPKNRPSSSSPKMQRQSPAIFSC